MSENMRAKIIRQQMELAGVSKADQAKHIAAAKSMPTVEELMEQARTANWTEFERWERGRKVRDGKW
jgi:hypothetical protein|tara:strand:- start:3041 stop:3241 length:201 start_codon:yes stop_codon:yes gene_type:complete